MEDEQARSEATLHLTIQNLKSLKETAFSPPCYVRYLPWRIEVMPRQTTSPDKHQRKSLGFFVQCNADSTSTTWSCYAKAEMRLISQKPDIRPLVRTINHLYHSGENDWGFSHYIAWDDVLNPNKGYINNNAITVEVHLSADMPNGIPLPEIPTSRVGNADNRVSEESRDNNLPSGPDSGITEVTENASSGMTEETASSAQNNAQIQNTENTTIEEQSQPTQNGVSTEAADHSNNIITSTSEQQQNVDDNPVLSVLQRVECILSSLLDTTQQHHNMQQQSVVNMEKDEYHYFALSVAAQLRKLPAHIAVDTQNKIQSTLSTARLTSMFANTPAGSSSSLT